jgi:hypothetical protein
MKKKLKLIKKLWAEIVVLLIALIWVFISFYLQSMSPECEWMGRSGAVMTLCAVIVEYRLSRFIYEDIHRANFLSKRVDLYVPFKPRVTKERKWVARFAHLFIISGTLLWGYGDLVS